MKTSTVHLKIANLDKGLQAYSVLDS